MSVVDCFPIGSIVACTTCFNENIEGSVLAFDPAIKMLILKCSTDSGNKKFNDVYIVNLDLCSDVQVKKEVMNSTNTSSSIPNHPPQSLNLQRLSTRIRNSVEQKKRLVSALAAGVTPEGQKLFMAIAKTITEISWQGPTIVVFGDTYIGQPYKAENVTGKDERQVRYIKKVVENHFAANSLNAATTAGQPTPPVSVGSGGGGNSTAASSPPSNDASSATITVSSPASSCTSTSASTPTIIQNNNNQSSPVTSDGTPSGFVVSDTGCSSQSATSA